VTHRRLLQISLRGILAWCALSAAGFLLARPIVEIVSPFFEGVVDSMQSNYTAYLSVVDAQGGPKIVMSCTAKRELLLPRGRIIPVFASFDCAKIDAVHALVPIVIFLVVVIAWPMKDRREALRRILCSAIVLPVVLALTTPLLLFGLVNSTLHPESFGADAQLRALLQPFVFMEMGGRWLLPLAATAVSIRLGGSSTRTRSVTAQR
jgi:hypothetical protein